jgi:hypothetical protein
MDLAERDRAAKELEAMIQRRARKGDVDPDGREENRLAWCGYFERLVACLTARAEEYDHRAQMLTEDHQPKGA